MDATIVIWLNIHHAITHWYYIDYMNTKFIWLKYISTIKLIQAQKT